MKIIIATFHNNYSQNTFLFIIILLMGMNPSARSCKLLYNWIDLIISVLSGGLYL